MAGTPELDFRKILDDAGPYPLEAYDFLRKGLAHTVKMAFADAAQAPADEDRHVTGQQLCLGLRDYAVQQYGLLAGAVLQRWHVSETEDFGRMVFALVDAGLMRKSDTDRIEDFRSIYDFAEAFPGPRSIGPIGPTPSTTSDN